MILCQTQIESRGCSNSPTSTAVVLCESTEFLSGDREDCCSTDLMILIPCKELMKIFKFAINLKVSTVVCQIIYFHITCIILSLDCPFFSSLWYVGNQKLQCTSCCMQGIALGTLSFLEPGLLQGTFCSSKLRLVAGSSKGPVVLHTSCYLAMTDRMPERRCCKAAAGLSASGSSQSALNDQL